MRRKQIFFSLVGAALLLLSSMAVSAQTTAPLFGQVVMQQADGKTVPVAGAMVDVYSVNTSSKYNTKTNKDGKFTFAGLPFTTDYIIAISAPNARPEALGGVKAGSNIDYKITLASGDGRRLTLDEAKALASGGSSDKGTASKDSKGTATKESAEDRKKREEREAAIASNEKNKNINEIINRTFKAGNEALNAGKYDEAIAQYDEGLAADANQPGILANKAEAIRLRGSARYNSISKQPDDASKNAARESANKDFKEAAETSTKAVEVLKAEPAPTDPAAQASRTANMLAALSVRALSSRLYATKADQSQADTAFANYQEYIAAITDPAKKLKAQLDAAQIYLDVGQGAKAAQEFQKILAANPDNTEAELGLGLSLFNTGDKANFQEAANHLQRFIDKAPDSHPLKQSAKESLDYLKTQENVKPQKTTATPGRRKG